MALAAPVGALAGAALGLPAGLLLAALHRTVAHRPALARIVAAAVCSGAVAGFAGLLAALGTSATWIALLTGAGLVVAPVTAAWKGPYLLGLAPPPGP